MSLYPKVEHKGCIDICACEEAVAQCVDRSPLHRCARVLAVRLDKQCCVFARQILSAYFGGAMGTNCMPAAAQFCLAVKWKSLAKEKWEATGSLRLIHLV